MESLASGRGTPCPSPEAVFNILASTSPDCDISQFGSFSPTVYDAAWLSMIQKPGVDGTSSQLFPQCREYVMKKQDASTGTWGALDSRLDGILSTLAALLALSSEEDDPSARVINSSELPSHIENAQRGVSKLLRTWKVAETDHVGFEVLVSSLLKRLEDKGFHFEFPQKEELFYLYQEKMTKFAPQMIYGHKQTTILHSLEALIGIIDYDQVGHHCTAEYGILGSPAATAAYLMNVSKWDDKAEAYLRRVVERYGNEGAVPAAFPTPIFELTWALSSLLSSVSPFQFQSSSSVANLKDFLTSTMKSQGWLAGFAPSLLPDADDTARSLITLQRLGVSVDLKPMIATFDADECFKTYEFERNPSFTANCNVLLALVELDDDEKHVSSIGKALKFLVSLRDRGELSDKWNKSRHYSTMLFSEALVAVLRKYNQGKFSTLSQSLLLVEIPRILCGLVQDTMTTVLDDGSWSNCLEETSYAALALAFCLCLPWESSVESAMRKQLSDAQTFISNTYPSDAKQRHLWIEKTTFRTSLLSVAYCSAAIHCEIPEFDWSDDVRKAFNPGNASESQKRLLKSLPLLAKLTPSTLDLILVESLHLSSHLKDHRTFLFDRDELPMSKDKYLGYIPMMWLACNSVSGYVLSTWTIKDMLVLSLFNFQVDEYMETVVSRLDDHEVAQLLKRLREICRIETSYTSNLEKKAVDRTNQSNGIASPLLNQVTAPLQRYIDYVLRHPAVYYTIGHELAIPVYNFLNAHIQHNQDNKQWVKQKRQGTIKGQYATADTSRSSYFDWVESTGADDTSCPFSYRFFLGLVSGSGSRVFQGARQKYYSDSLVRHLAIMCRQYNDWGSAARDATEGNLNSLDFEEFKMSITHTYGSPVKESPSASVVDEEARRDLMAIAEFEREQMSLALAHLEETVEDKKVMKALRVFVDVTDLFGQLYVKKDVASRKHAK